MATKAGLRIKSEKVVAGGNMALWLLETS
jgi:hypothetical protein